MKKQLTALLCALFLLLGTVPFAAATEPGALRAADTLATLGLVQGTGRGYDLSAPATRAQAATLLVRLGGAVAAAKADPWFAGFRDVPTWAADAVDYAVRQKWMAGASALDFRPGDTITANDWCAGLLRLLGHRDFAQEEAAALAHRLGVISAPMDESLTRGDLFESMVRALSAPYQDGSGTVVERLVAGGLCSRAAANALGLLTETLTARQIADRHLSAVFCLEGYERQSDAEDPEVESDTAASGFFIAADGVAVTNYHSIDGLSYAEAILTTGERYPVESVLWYDVKMDLAVLRISKTSTARKPTPAFSFLALAGTGDARPGDRVYTLGNPLGLGLAVSEGVISALDREVERYALPCIMSTADISEGSSGGALLNARGQVVAITSGAYVYGNGMYLAVPADPLLSLELTGEGQTLAQVRATVDDAA